MQEQEKSTTETVTLPTGGSIPGIPGTHGPGRYLINWIERTITPIVDAVESAIEHAEEAFHPEPAPVEQSAEPVNDTQSAPAETPAPDSAPEAPAEPVASEPAEAAPTTSEPTA